MDPVVTTDAHGAARVLGGFETDSAEDVEVEPSALDGAPGDERAKVDLKPKDVTITVDLSAGPHSAIILTTDLTVEYVHENSAYST